MTTKGLAHTAACTLALLFSSVCLADADANDDGLASLIEDGAVEATSLVSEGRQSCNACSDCYSCNASRDGFWYAGTEVTMMQLDARSGGRINLSFSDITAPGVATASFLDGNGINDFTYAPRIWFGRQFDRRFGIVGRYWNLETTESNMPAFAPNTTPTGTNFATINETDTAHLYAADIEGTCRGELGKWKLDGTLGARHASIGVTTDVLAFGVFTTGNFVNLTLQNGFSFDGTGGTGSLSARRQLGDSPFHLLLGVRGSYMAGHTDSMGRADGAVASSPSSPLVGAATVTRNNAESELDIIEYQVGVQWEHPLQSLPATVFLRTAFEYQMWDIDGPPTGGAGFGGTIGELTTNSFASAGLGHANLCGLGVATGFSW